MREVNFSIPNANKASVGITTALYDRRALDCTSTLPLINSLNNLAYLTASSARIRDILTLDGGVERLVCILKEGRRTNNMDCWKWNLAFQCVVNIGVRGSEVVRTRVVEADMVPVIATILDNYIKVIDRCREKADAEFKRKVNPSSTKARVHDLLASQGLDNRIRRQAPPPIEIPSPLNMGQRDSPADNMVNIPTFSLSSPPERTTFAHTHHHRHSHVYRMQSRTPGAPPAGPRTLGQPLLTSVPTDAPQDTFGIRPVRVADRLPSMVPLLPTELMQPDSPTTPLAPVQLQPGHNLQPTLPGRPSLLQQHSTPSSDEGSGEEAGPSAVTSVANNEPLIDLQNDINMQDMGDDAMLDGGGSPMRLEPRPSEQADDTFEMARAVVESSITNTAPPATNLAISPIQNITLTAPQPQLNPYVRYIQERSATTGGLPSMPRDEDVLMCLQLLAYVSKYCNLRSYFQHSHLVPKLKIPASEIALLDGEAAARDAMDEELIEEYLQPDDFNIFPLVEKFTVRHHTTDMQYWAGVVMRNLCRKDDARGGIRQCAYYQCGKWEEFTRQFAKCRRCRRTKYCSKECQKSAWVYHRHWCVAAQP
ncbi:hypothetical protein EJ06DRAFT_92905 [Trichodelitschia bisporula]|uniref:MYND-type zinc finger protein samB n=1 Tax=Trichodelitschia bisporula TaxID=703511 RepID=A0A6G1HS13_9PEZI|nr:hypothetical protein EJ06DRAFT_92905 [Trichodelitschia bisporula]